jgi:1-acyl-sn-glycerol-3-phosphate acyltransferase
MINEKAKIQLMSEVSMLKKSLFYSLLKVYTCFCLRKLFYRKTNYHFDEVIDYRQPLIIAANHQNALMDCLLTICAIKTQPVYLARADIFKNPIIARLLSIVKIAPIYRIRDGRSSLQNNDSSFELSTNVLLNRGTIALFPEGAHNRRQQLLPLKKGLARIAFQAQQKAKDSQKIFVLPLGISYSNYDKPQSRARLQFGKPIDVSMFMADYEKNPARAALNLNSMLTFEIKKRCIDIESQVHYDVLHKLLHTYCLANQKGRYDPETCFSVSKHISERFNKYERQLPQEFATLIDIAHGYYSALDKSGIEESSLFKPDISNFRRILEGLHLISGFPVFLSGFLLNLLPYGLPYLFTKYRLKDPQFISSILFAASGLITFPLFNLLYVFVSFRLFESLTISLLLPICSLIFGLYTFRYRHQWSALRNRYKMNETRRKMAAAYQDLLAKQHLVLQRINELL